MKLSPIQRASGNADPRLRPRHGSRPNMGTSRVRSPLSPKHRSFYELRAG
jgi:hypothetical protein